MSAVRLIKASTKASSTFKNIFTIGLTGGICSGKSNITKDLQELGASVIDADKLGHLAYAKGSKSLDQIVKTFGSDIVNDENEIDRKKLGSIVFTDKKQMKKLTDIVWPCIEDFAQKEIKELDKKGVKVVVIEAAVLIEANWKHLVDEIWVVQVPKDVAISRLMKRNNLNEKEANDRLSSQLTNEERIKHANVVINSDRKREETKKAVQEFYTKHIQSKISNESENKTEPK